ncbi:MAG TPA: hypothetical protein VNA89_04435 [Gemmatimonadaceae bacterium]|nr:hypothetical protein [Gemmatimonadaceae bacterium]
MSARLLLIATVAIACVPKAPPLRGAVAPARLPATELPRVFQRIVFDWEYRDPDATLRGEGAARIAPPDSVRLDLFLAGGLGSGHAFLIGDTVSAPGGALVRRVLPSPPLLWAALGRLHVAHAADTVVRAERDTMRADIGRSPVFRVTFARDSLVAVERIDGGRITERIARRDRVIRYAHAAERRSLTLTITRVDTLSFLDASIWDR